MIDIQLEGNWLGVKLALAQLPSSVNSSAIWGQRKVAEGLVKRVKQHLNRQDLGWVPKSSKTNSGDSRVLIDTETYYNNIKAWKQGNTYNAGVKKSAYNAHGISVAYYANLHETGTDRLPARPLWAPSFKEMGGHKGVKKIVTQAIYDKVKKLRAVGFEVTIERL